MVEFATQVKRRRGTTAENDVFTGAEGEITVDLEKHELRVHDGQTQGGFVIGAGGSGSGRNIGDMFYTTRTDTGLAGAVECNGATYNTTDYTGEGSIGELLEGGLLDYISLTDYATAISTKGYCDKIGWDGTGTTSFRVPKLAPKRHVVKVQDPTAGNNYTWYRLYNDGWIEQGGYVPATGTLFTGKPITLPVEMSDNNYSVSKTTHRGAATTNSSEWGWWGDVQSNQPEKTNKILYLSVASTSFCFGVYWTVTGQSAIVSDPTERAMIQLASGATDEALEVCTQVLADVADLKDMHNVTSTGKEAVVGWGIPAYDSGILLSGWGTVNSNFSVPTDGILHIVITSVSALEQFYIDDRISCALSNASNYQGWAVSDVFISKGTHTWRTSTTPSRIIAVAFYPFKGVNQ